METPSKPTLVALVVSFELSEKHLTRKWTGRELVVNGRQGDGSITALVVITALRELQGHLPTKLTVNSIEMDLGVTHLVYALPPSRI